MNRYRFIEEKTTQVSDDERGWGRVRLDEPSRLMLRSWVMEAKKNAKKRFDARGDAIRAQVKQTLLKMPPEDDWFYKREMRLEGNSIDVEGDYLTLERKVKETGKAAEIRKVESGCDSFRQDIKMKLARKKMEMETSLSEIHGKVQIDADLRARELRRACKELKREHEEEEKRAREEEGAVSSEMVNRHKDSMYNIEQLIVKETEKTEMEWNRIDNERRKIYAQEEKILLRSVKDRDTQSSLDIGRIETNTWEEIVWGEKEWRSRALGWLNIAVRKVEEKAEEDRRNEKKNEERKHRQKRFKE